MTRSYTSASSCAALLLFATPLYAESPGSAGSGDWYVSVFAGASSLGDVDTQFADGLAFSDQYSVEFDTGFVLGGAIGMRINDSLRGEIELSYTGYKADSYSYGDSGPGAASGDLRATYLLANLWYDIPTQSRFTPYLGGGVGIGHATADTNFDSNAWGYGSGETGFAWQVGVGFSYELSEQAALDVGYRYRVIDGVDFNDNDGSDFYGNGDVRSSSVQVGLRYTF